MFVAKSLVILITITETVNLNGQAYRTSLTRIKFRRPQFWQTEMTQRATRERTIIRECKKTFFHFWKAFFASLSSRLFCSVQAFFYSSINQEVLIDSESHFEHVF